VLGNLAILQAIKEARIVIKPFNEKQLGPNSYDVRIGQWIVRQQYASTSPLLLSDPISPHELWQSPTRVQDGIIRVAPGELLLAHTEEFIACYQNVVGELASRSSLMRMGIAVCVDAGLGDVGFASRWTLEVYNHTRREIVIPVGSRVAQMKFHEVDNCDLTYQAKGGTYGVMDWDPNDMLPRSSLM
jgi:dCTP deaminase